jgi:quercetin dioxygenase-like cupin family protein
MIVKKNTDIGFNKAPAEYFVGTAWIHSLVKHDGIEGNALRVTFEPGARNNWHYHPKGQILIVTEGKGLVQKKGEAIQVLLPGDVVVVKAHEVHWHGAAAESVFTHIAVQLFDEGVEETIWLEAVTDKEYAAIS